MNWFQQTFEQTVHWRSKRTAIIDAGATCAFAELARRVDEFAADLSGRTKQGDAVALRIRGATEFIVAAFACWKCNLPIIPISHQLPNEEVDEILRTTDAAWLLDEEAATGRLKLDPVAGTQPASPSLTEAYPEAAYLRFTSGTTGDAKGVVLTGEAVAARTAASAAAMQITPADRVLCVLPLAFHFIASVASFLRAGATVILSPGLAADAIALDALRHQATVLYAAPLHYRVLTASAAGTTLPPLRLAISTSASLDVETARRFSERFATPVSQAYGVIEGGLPLINIADAADFPESVGRAAPGCDAAIVEGELAVRTPGMFAGYLHPLRRIEEACKDGWFLTGDLATIDQAGRVTIHGRRKSVINVAGNKVFPEEVEAVLLQHDAVALAKVSSRQHPRFGEIVVAEVVANDGHAIDVEDVLRFCRKRLAPYKVPQFLEAVTTIAQTPSGKTRRG